ncbi:major facilitator superfamily transporter [Colletotrichum graminicola]|uniref:Major facilitator superfamily transporter n=1 Tax=Colletotrichum graminicola (strain M1.001 / M2 / FGSC 10212) TaxID=645133 RepID=E3QXB4_COLGM|nr:major facilitator superfamily transporter [Colletotrichum graminicola M1.001]EFQ35502.1 major facilitator superfamily transporter [Colletotrichum graminicola M1.001]WDK08753.1 major facilitator superfamily transporter [Colletotrichum graminicola]
MSRSSSRSSRAMGRPVSGELSGSIYLIASDGQTLKLPMPSNSPYDPLGWGLPRRVLAMGVLILYSIVSIMETQAASLMYPSLAAEFDGKTGNFPMNILVSTPSTLSLGIGAFLWIPLSVAVGRRPVFLLASCCLTLATVLAANASGFYQLLGALSLQGFSAGLGLSASLLAVIDLTFIDERPHALGILWSLSGSGGLLSLTSVPALSASGWRGFYSAWIFPCLAVLVCVFVFLPETYFVRPVVAFDGRILVQGGSEKIQIYDGWEQTVGEGPDNAARQEPAPETLWQSIVRKWGVQKRGAGFKEMGTCYVQTMLCACNPLVFWVAVLNALNVGAVLLIGETYAVVMAQPPYSLPQRVISMVSPVSAVGSLLAWPVSAILTSRVARRLTLRNGGVRDAEHYLIAFLPPVLAGVTSVVLYGLAVHYEWNFICIFVSYAINAFSAAAFGIASTLWVTEAFPRWAAPAMVIVGGAGYLLSFATSSTITPWLDSQGYLGASLEYGAILLIVGAVALPLAFCGKSLRQYIHGRWGASEAGALRPQ